MPGEYIIHNSPNEVSGGSSGGPAETDNKAVLSATGSPSVTTTKSFSFGVVSDGGRTCLPQWP